MDCHVNGMWVIKHNGGKLPLYTSLVDANLKAKRRDFKKVTADEIKESERSATDCQMAMCNSLGSDWARFGKLIEDL